MNRAPTGGDRLTRDDRKVPHGPIAWRVHLVLHLHRLDDAEDLAGADLVALGHLDREHRPLHGADDRVAARGVGTARAGTVGAPARELRPRRLRDEAGHLESMTVQLHFRHVFA